MAPAEPTIVASDLPDSKPRLSRLNSEGARWYLGREFASEPQVTAGVVVMVAIVIVVVDKAWVG